MDDCGLDNDDMRLINTMIDRRVRKYQIVMALCLLLSILVGVNETFLYMDVKYLSQRLNDHIDYNNHIWLTTGETVKIQTECIGMLDHRLDRSKLINRSTA